ncbi:MAG TPA: DUF503 domain-containing protein [Syntrophorhabdales bacterium]|nr:DUF503 domain-containing protein [Syntrophorhabdales bacterium]
MVVGISRVEIFLPDNHSLKEKRQATKRIVERTRQKFNVSVMEVDRTNLWQRVTVGFSVVGNGRDVVERMVENIHLFIEELYIGKVIDTRTEIMMVGDEI